jgi:hypothetical protein
MCDEKLDACNYFSADSVQSPAFHEVKTGMSTRATYYGKRHEPHAGP